MDPGDIELPAFFDTILTYLAETLPSPLYSLVINLLSHLLALTSALITLLTSLLSKSPLQWDAQTVLPPLVSLIAAYLALAGLYRTTSWMIRTSFWFMKWTIILGFLAAGVGWYIGATQGQISGLPNAGLISYAGNLALDMINGPGRSAAGGERSARTRFSQPHSKPAKRPKPWESFDRQREWQYSEDQFAGGETSEIEKMINNLIGTAGRVFGDDSWWTGVKNMMDGVEGRSRAEDFKEGSGRTRGKANSKSRSR